LSRNVISGTYGFFAEHALCKGKFKASIDMQPTSRDVVRKVGETPGAVGYSGIGYLSDKVRALPLAATEGQPFVPATAENIYSGKYPLSRYLYIYVNKVPGSPLPTLEREFLRMVLSTRGQSLITVNGFIRLSPQVVDEELAKLN
jgi:phosphate transport system substrate-binding protein